LDEELINKINLIYPIIIDNTILHDETEEQLKKMIELFKQKFETKILQK
jgi:hypothetical protein